MKNLVDFSVICFSIAFIIIKIATAFPKSENIVLKEPDPKMVRELMKIERVVNKSQKAAISVLPLIPLYLIIKSLVKHRKNNN